MTNRYGVDISYFKKELAKLSRDLENYTPIELARYFDCLCDVAGSGAIKERSLIEGIGIKQVLAGEQAVIDNLKSLGLDT